MAQTLTPLRVRIGIGGAGAAAYPAFNSLPVVQATGLDWSRYVDTHGSGWLYDNLSGHQDDDAESPRGLQWGVLLVPAQFANEAVVAFSDDCTILTEAELQSFYDTRYAYDQPQVERDINTLQGLKADLDLVEAGLAVEPNDAKLQASRTSLRRQIKQALDPDHAARGVRANPRRTWTAFKAKHKVTIG